MPLLNDPGWKPGFEHTILATAFLLPQFLGQNGESLAEYSDLGLKQVQKPVFGFEETW